MTKSKGTAMPVDEDIDHLAGDHSADKLATLLALVKPGDRIACVNHIYPDAYRLNG